MRFFSGTSATIEGQAAFTFGDFRLEPDGTLLHGTDEIHLAPKELEALRVLLLHAGQIVTPAELRQALWGDVHVTADSVPRCISSLRNRLGSEESIRAIYKRGYRLTLPVHRESPSGDQLPRLAIMPFSCGPNVPEHLGRAVAEEATTRLTGLRSPVLSMLARDSAFNLAAQGVGAQQAGEKLKADLVLTGTVKALSSHFRLRAEMVRVSDGIQIWVEEILVPKADTAALEMELVERILFRAGSGALPSLRRAPEEIDPQAYEAFLLGRFEWQSFERHRMDEGLRHLRRAIDLEPRFTQARLDLAHAWLAHECLGYVTPALGAEQVRRIAAEMPPDCEQNAAILPALGWIAFHVDRDLPSALQLFARSRQDATDPWETRMHWLLAVSRRQFGPACEVIQRSLEADPYAPWLNAALAWTWHLAGRADESVRQVEQCLNVAPNHLMTGVVGGMILAFNGEAKRATAITSELARLTPHFDIAMAVHAYALACAGERDAALEILERLQWMERERFTTRSFSAAAYLALGDGESALAELHAADRDRCPWYFLTLSDPRLDSLRGSAEFQTMQGQLDAMEEAAAEALEDAELSGASA